MGPGWRSSNPSVERAKTSLLAFYQRLAGSQYNQLVSQYRGAGIDPQLVSAWIDPRPVPHQFSPTEDVARLVGQAHIPIGLNTQLVLAYPAGATFVTPGETGFGYAYHSYEDGVTFSALSYIKGAPEELVYAGSHEYTETVTDPLGNPADQTQTPPQPGFGFGAPQGGQIQEVADICENNGEVLSNGLAVAQVYDNVGQGCTALPLDYRGMG